MEQNMHKPAKGHQDLADRHSEQKKQVPKSEAAPQKQHTAAERSEKKAGEAGKKKKVNRTENDGHDYIL